MLKFPIVSVDEMIALEQQAIAHGFSVPEMMEQAGSALAQVIDNIDARNGKKQILGLVGTGNNGGDTLTALLYLVQRGWPCDAFVVSPEKADIELINRARKSGVNIIQYSDECVGMLLEAACQSADVIIDGILGTGINLPLSEKITEILQIIAKKAHHAIIVAVDCPSGIDCRSGEVAPGVLKADMTVCMGAVKRGLLSFPAFTYAGKLSCVDFGLMKRLPSCLNDSDFLVDDSLVMQMLPMRPADAHKGIFGKLTIIGGCSEYRGAPLLAGMAAYRLGTGLVKLALPASLISNLHSSLLEAVWMSLPEDNGYLSENAAGICIANLSRDFDTLLIGPGLGLTNSTRRFCEMLIHNLPEHGIHSNLKNIKFVIDADALRIISEILGWNKKLKERVILTPHPGEMAALTGLSVQEIQKNRMTVAKEYAVKWNCVLVLKGALTIIADTNGRLCIVPGASSALAKAGSGDVLAGMISGLVAQGLDLFPAAYCATWLHFNCGLSAIKMIGAEESVMATDLINSIPGVLKKIKGSV